MSLEYFLNTGASWEKEDHMLFSTIKQYVHTVLTIIYMLKYLDYLRKNQCCVKM